MSRKLSRAQQEMLASVDLNGYSETPFGMGRTTARWASGWYRTAQSLADRGLVEFVRWGDHYRVVRPGGESEALRASCPHCERPAQTDYVTCGRSKCQELEFIATGRRALLRR